MNQILKLRKSISLSQKELADAVGVHQTAVSQWETNKTYPDIDTAKLLAELFNVSIDTIFGKGSNKVIGSQAIRVPVYGRIPAGIPFEAINDIIDYEEVPISWAVGNKEFFALKIDGDSMFPKYIHDDVVIFEKISTCENGADCAVMVNGYDATFKKVLRKVNGIVLQPLNADYEPMFYNDEEIQNLPVTVIGIAKEIRRPV